MKIKVKNISNKNTPMDIPASEERGIFKNRISFVTTSGKLNSERLEFNNLKAFTLLGLSALFYVAYLSTCGVFHKIYAYTDLNAISPWLVRWALESDGIELYVMTLAMPLFLSAAYLISISKTLNNPLFQKPWVIAFYLIIPISLFALNLVYKEPIYFMSIMLFLLATIFSYSLYYATKINVSKRVQWIINSVYFLFLLGYGFALNSGASIIDYGYLIGPANKLLQGEKLGSFYMQYNLLTTSLSMIMQKMHLLANEMQIVFITIYVLWIMLYKKLATVLFQNKVIVLYFLTAILLVRGASVWGGHILVPQVSPLRLDLWVPLLLVVLYFGYESMVTAILFALMYLLDDMFGFLYLGLYLFSIVIIYYAKYKQTNINSFPIKEMKCFVPALIAALIHYAIFNTFTTPAGKTYAAYHLGFMPIALSSSFWLMVWMLPVCLYLLIQNKQSKGLILFIFGLVCIQLTYFFGRSHDNNLLNISGIFVFILFLSIDRLYSNIKKQQIGIAIISLLIGAIVLNYNSSIWRALNNVIENKIVNGIVYIEPLESQIRKNGEYLKTLNTDKIIFVTDYDSYLNYRLGYKQVGYYSPFLANIENTETVKFLFAEIRNGYRLIVFPSLQYSIFPESIEPYNTELAKITRSETFTLDSLQNNLMELKLVPCKWK
jgi:hypothetical protein